MVKRLLVFAQERGGGNIVARVAQALQTDPAPAFDLTVVAHRQGAAAFAACNVGHRLLETLVPRLPLALDDAAALLERLQTEGLFGAVGNLRLDKSNGVLFEAARQLAIPSVAVLDCWQGWDRFHDHDRPLVFAPDLLIVIDAHSRRRMVCEGLPDHRLAVGGHPVLESLAERPADPQLRRHLRAEKGIEPQTPLVVLASQMLFHRRADQVVREPFHAIGTGREKVLDEVRSALAAAWQRHPAEPPPVLLLRLHSKEPAAAGITDQGPIRLIVDQQADPRDIYCMADAVVGFDTMMLVEAALAGCRVAAWQPEQIQPAVARNEIERGAPIRCIRQAGTLADWFAGLWDDPGRRPSVRPSAFAGSLARQIAVLHRFFHAAGHPMAGDNTQPGGMAHGIR